MTWHRFGPREAQVLSILRRQAGSCAEREEVEALEDEGRSLGHTTVSTVLDRLAQEGGLRRPTAMHAGSRRFRSGFYPEAHVGEFGGRVVEDVERMLGDDGLHLLAEQATEAR